MGEDDKLGIRVAGFEKLRVQVHREIVQFLLREHGIFDFLFGLLLGAGEGLGRVIAAARLQRQLLRILQLDLQGVKAAIELKILRNERENVGILGGLGHTPEAFFEIVAVVKENAAGAVG